MVYARQIFFFIHNFWKSLRFLWIQVLTYKRDHLYITLFTNDYLSIWVLIYKWGHLYIILLADNKLTINISISVNAAYTFLYLCLVLYVAFIMQEISALPSIQTCIASVHAYFSNFLKIHRSVLSKITIDLLYFWDLYVANLQEKNFLRSTI